MDAPTAHILTQVPAIPCMPLHPNRDRKRTKNNTRERGGDKEEENIQTKKDLFAPTWTLLKSHANAPREMHGRQEGPETPP